MADQPCKLWTGEGQVLGIPVVPWSLTQDPETVTSPGVAHKLARKCFELKAVSESFSSNKYAPNVSFLYPSYSLPVTEKCIILTQLTRESNIVFYSIYFNKDGENCSVNFKNSIVDLKAPVITTTNSGI